MELFNRSSAPVSLAGLSLQYGTANGEFGASPADGGAQTSITFLPNVSVGPGQYFLVGMSTTNAGVGAPLPTPDLIGPTDLAPQNGKVALARTTAPLGCGTASNRCAAADVVDLVGYGTATDYAGTAGVPALSAANAALRDGAGCVDTGQSSADFSLGAPAPRSSATALHPCGNGGDAGEAGVVVGVDGASSGGNDAAPTDDGGAVAPPGDASADDASAIDAGEADAGVTEDAATGDDGGGARDGGTSALVISQVFGGGGTAGSPYAGDFVELFNRSGAPVSLAGLALQYADKAAAFGKPLADSGSSANVLALPAATLVAGEYFLVGLGTKGADGGADLPTPDAIGTINLAAGAGKVAITTVTTPLGCGAASARCPGTYIVDLVGYGASSDYEGTAPVAALTKTTAALRKGNGCADTRDNAADFSVGAPAPRNSASAYVSCAGSATDAGSGGGDAGGNDADAGATGTDAGVTFGDDSGAIVPADAGAPPEDAGRVADDSGAPVTEDGGSSGSGGSSGCSCSTPGASGAYERNERNENGLSTLAGAALFAAIARRRRATRGESAPRPRLRHPPTE